MDEEIEGANNETPTQEPISDGMLGAEQEKKEALSDEDYESQKKRLDIENLQKELQRKDEEIARLKQNTEQRKTFAKWVLGVVSGWVLWVVITTFVHACKNGLTEREICVLLGATAIVSLATTVLKGLFKSDET